LNEAQELSRRITKLKVTMTLETGESGKAFGSITAKDLAEKLLNELGVQIDRHKIVLEQSIKSTGVHEVPVKLHPDVTAKFSLNVKSSTPEVPEEPEEATPVESKGFKAKAKARHK
jgi:large subunit ribosomal protein L9